MNHSSSLYNISHTIVCVLIQFIPTMQWCHDISNAGQMYKVKMGIQIKLQNGEVKLVLFRKHPLLVK
jgi:hypothetical protein